MATPFVDSVRLFVDGGCRGNPGPGAIGIVIRDGANCLLYEHSDVIGSATNNRAEYQALIKGLDLCARFTRRRVTCFCDSTLVVNHMNRVWRLKNDHLRAMFHQVKDRERPFDTVVYQHVGRLNGDIKRAHKLLNDAFEGRCVSRAAT